MGAKKIILFLPPLKFSSWANNQMNRLIGENKINMCIQEIHINTNIPKTVKVKLGIYVILDERRKGMRGLRFQRRWLVEEEWNIHGR